jgi:hypothetical protein
VIVEFAHALDPPTRRNAATERAARLDLTEFLTVFSPVPGTKNIALIDIGTSEDVPFP